MYLISQFFLATFATLGFAIIFNVTRENLSIISIAGGITWIIYKLVLDVNNHYLISGVIASLALGVFGEIFARVYKKPATILIIPGLIPLVPGSGMYYTMYYFLKGDIENFIKTVSDTFFMTVALSIGIVVASSIFKTFKAVKKKD